MVICGTAINKFVPWTPLTIFCVCHHTRPWLQGGQNKETLPLSLRDGFSWTNIARKQINLTSHLPVNSDWGAIHWAMRQAFAGSRTPWPSIGNSISITPIHKIPIRSSIQFRFNYLDLLSTAIALYLTGRWTIIHPFLFWAISEKLPNYNAAQHCAYQPIQPAFRLLLFSLWAFN